MYLSFFLTLRIFSISSSPSLARPTATPVENQSSTLSAPAPQGDASQPPPQGASAPAPSQATDIGTKKSPTSSIPVPDAVKRRPPSPRPRANTLPMRTTPDRSPVELMVPHAPQVFAPPNEGSTLSPQEGAGGHVTSSVASQESSGSGGSQQAADYSGSL